MAAGLGFKDFTTGEVLTAADVDGYLMQGIWVFASAAARDAAVTSPQEGNFAYLSDTNTTTYYTGSAWTNLDTTGMVNPMTTTGDTIYSSSGSTPARLGIGSTGQVLTVAGGVPSWATPQSTLTFTHRSNLTDVVNGIEYNGTNLYVAWGATGKLMTSTDGITWTARTSGFGTNEITFVAFGNGLWVAVGQNGTLTTSTDGITWTARTSNMSTNYINHVTYANSIWVAVGNGGGATNTGGIIYSTDGITWTRKSQSLTIGTTYYRSIFNGTNWIVAAAQSTNNYLYASTPSGTWTVGADGSGQNLRSIWWDGTRSIVIADGGVPRFSTSTTLGTTTLLNGIDFANNQNKIYYYNGNLYYIGTYVMVYSTTPMSGNYGKQNNNFLPPTTQTSIAGASADNSGSIWVGASGYIIGSNDVGQIFTSF